MKKIFTLCCILTVTLSYAQIGIGTATPDSSAALDITATGKGLLIPRMDSATRVAIATPLPDGLMVFQTDQRKGFWYAVNNVWLYIPDKTQTAGDNLGSHSATQTLNLNAQQLTGFTSISRGDSIAQASFVASVNQPSAALQTKSQLGINNLYTRSLLSGFGKGPEGIDVDYGNWSHSYRSAGWAVIASGGPNPRTANHWVGLGQGPSGSSKGSVIRIVDGSQGAGKLLTSDANGNGTWRELTSFSANTVFNGFTKLGAAAPGIKLLELTGTLPIAGPAQRFVAHGLDDAKIVSVTAMANEGANKIPPNLAFNAMLYGVYIYAGQVVMQTSSAASSSAVFGKPITIIIAYKE